MTLLQGHYGDDDLLVPGQMLVVVVLRVNEVLERMV